jgi:uncharacterized membrane protein YedE/YeeE
VGTIEAVQEGAAAPPLHATVGAALAPTLGALVFFFGGVLGSGCSFASVACIVEGITSEEAEERKKKKKKAKPKAK